MNKNKIQLLSCTKVVTHNKRSLTNIKRNWIPKKPKKMIEKEREQRENSDSQIELKP